MATPSIRKQTFEDKFLRKYSPRWDRLRKNIKTSNRKKYRKKIKAETNQLKEELENIY